jgi:hypothetical protein
LQHRAGDEEQQISQSGKLHFASFFVNDWIGSGALF